MEAEISYDAVIYNKRYTFVISSTHLVKPLDFPKWWYKGAFCYINEVTLDLINEGG